MIAAPGAADPCAVAPETARNYEIGAKADLFDRRLQLTAALFRNERSNFRVPSNDPAQPATLQVLDGRSRVDGIALGVSGNITPEWTIFANYTYLDSEVLQSVSDFCLATPGATGCGNSAAIPDPQRGDRLIQTPEPFGQPVHHLSPAVRARGRLRLHLSGQLRDPSAQPAPAHPIFRRRLSDPPRSSCPTRSTTG